MYLKEIPETCASEEYVMASYTSPIGTTGVIAYPNRMQDGKAKERGIPDVRDT